MSKEITLEIQEIYRLGNLEIVFVPIDHSKEIKNRAELITLATEVDAAVFEYHPDELRKNESLSKITVLFKSQLSERSRIAKDLCEIFKEVIQITIDPAYDWKFQSMIAVALNTGYMLPISLGIAIDIFNLNSFDLKTILIGNLSLCLGIGNLLSWGEKTLHRLPNENDFRWLIIAKGLQTLTKEDKYKRVALMYPQKHIEGIKNLLDHPKLLNLMWTALIPLRNLKFFRESFLQIRIRNKIGLTNSEIK